jgi:hypothetical protein
MNEHKTLEVGEKYLSVVILGNIRLSAFKNKNKTKDNQPDFTGEGIAIWVQKKKAAKSESVLAEDFI